MYTYYYREYSYHHCMHCVPVVRVPQSRQYADGGKGDPLRSDMASLSLAVLALSAASIRAGRPPDAACSGDAQSLRNATHNLCIWEHGRDGVSFAPGAVASCDAVAFTGDGTFGYTWPRGVNDDAQQRSYASCPVSAALTVSSSSDVARNDVGADPGG